MNNTDKAKKIAFAMEKGTKKYPKTHELRDRLVSAGLKKSAANNAARRALRKLKNEEKRKEEKKR